MAGRGHVADGVPTAVGVRNQLVAAADGQRGRARPAEERAPVIQLSPPCRLANGFHPLGETPRQDQRQQPRVVQRLGRNLWAPGVIHADAGAPGGSHFLQVAVVRGVRARGAVLCAVVGGVDGDVQETMALVHPAIVANSPRNRSISSRVL